MGTTLQNGVYLPNEGERNCYAGLKTNWEILDQKVADVTALQQAVAGALHREIVESLPTTDIDPNTIYMILSGTSATENVYNEFMYVNNAWELIGTSATDLTNYYTKAEVDGKLLLKANTSDLTSHTGDTTIHVTANDKSKWNTVALIKQLRLVNAQVGSATTIAFVNIDDTNGIKVGDKCMDLDGKLFEITAVDTTNQTVTVGSALIDLALDGNVVHTSGNETVGGQKTFTNRLLINNNIANIQDDVPYLLLKNPLVERASTTLEGYQQIRFVDKNDNNIGVISVQTNTSGTTDIILTSYSQDGDATRTTGIVIRRSPTVSKLHGYSDNVTSLGDANRRWSKVYAMSYYYGNNNIEFSTKFVTTDTAQTVTGTKTFSSNTLIYNSDNTASTPNLMLQSSKIQLGDTSNSDTQGVIFNAGSSYVARVDSYKDGAGTQNLQYRVRTKDTSNNIISAMYRLRMFNTGTAVLESESDNLISLGRSGLKWKDTCTYLINGLTPSSLSLPVAPSSTSYVDISGYITVLDSSSANTYTPPSNGYITFSVTGNQVQIFHEYGLQGRWSIQTGSTNRGFIPVLGGVEVKIYVTASSVDKFWFIPCQGNV